MRSIILLVIAGSILTCACEEKSACEKNGATVTIDSDHPHEANIPGDHFGPAKGGTYAVKGAAGHEHALALKDADFAKLKKGEAVKTRVSSVRAHTHEATIQCK